MIVTAGPSLDPPSSACCAPPSGRPGGVTDARRTTSTTLAPAPGQPTRLATLATPQLGGSKLSRRQTLTGAAALGAVPILAACGGADPQESAAEAPAAGEALGATSGVPVGGGTIYAAQKVVVTQPTEGDFRAFSAVCTHQACLVSRVTAESIDCTCHGSKFSVQDGSVLVGPANSPLAKVDVTVDGDQITTS